jgi:UDP-N-acetylglucosamine 3-dehydrogenase
MSPYTCAVVAAGSQGRVHARGYLAARALGVRLAAIADPDIDAARELAGDLGIPAVYDSHVELLKAERPDVLSICTPPSTHLEIARAAVAAGVRAIHCEKPIATSYADVLEMRRLAADAGVQLTVNLQRRFEPVHKFARDQIAAGAIGDVISLEGYCPNLPDFGSHIVDLLLFYRGDRAPGWVIGQAEIIFATYESSRSRRRVPLPLDPVDNALLSGLERGFWRPAGEQHSTY